MPYWIMPACITPAMTAPCEGLEDRNTEISTRSL